MTSTQTA